MSNALASADAVDTRRVLRWYAALTGASGLVLIVAAAWVNVTVFQDTAFRTLVFCRTIGALLISSATAAWAVSRIDDAVERARALGWFLIGHTVSMVAGGRAVGTGVSSSLIDPAMVTWATAGFVLLYVWNTAAGEPFFAYGRGALSVAGGTRLAHAPAASRYEDAIRRAAAQEERHRLARDLHDSVKQQLFAIHTAAATAQARLGADATGVAAAIDGVRASARDALAEMDAMLDQLREAPLELNGLVASLRKQCEALRLRTGAEVSFDFADLPAPSTIAPGILPEVQRIAQEALSNVARHARARHVRVSLVGVAGYLRLSIDDDGSGFDPQSAATGMGLSNMRTRAEGLGGTLACRSVRGAGTTVTLSVAASGRAPEDARPYLVRAVMWGLLMVVAIGPIPWRGRDGVSFLMVPLVSVAAFAFLRSMRAYQRVRAVRQVAAR